LAPLLGDKINVKLIQGSWDEILRLSDANLSRAYLSRAYLKGVYLIDANLDSANLDSADLSSADLSSANLDSANLRSADLRGADLSSANLRSADLRGADLRGADLSCFMELTEKPKKPICTDLKGVKNLTFQQIKAAEHWEQACYDPELRKQLNLPPENPKNCAGEGEDK
jgi:hypothetical protein